MAEDRVVHRVKLNKNPRWIKASFSGQYNGIMFKFTYREYVHDEADAVSKAFVFTWPGRIPDNKEFAEEGIRALFAKSEIDYKVLEDFSMEELMEEEEVDIMNKLVDKSIEEIDDTLQER